MPRKPYVWVTWLTKLLAGEHRCEWALWFKANNRGYEQIIDPNFDLDAWTAEHDRQVIQRAEFLRSNGWKVSVEDSNKFTLVGEFAVLGGKADLFATKEHPNLYVTHPGRHAYMVEDVKTGKERESDKWQVRIYQYAYPRVIKSLHGLKIIGVLVYSAGRQVEVEPMTIIEIGKFAALMQMAAADLEPPRTPSRAECASCNIKACPDRDNSPELEGATKDF